MTGLEGPSGISDTGRGISLGMRDARSCGSVRMKWYQSLGVSLPWGMSGCVSLCGQWQDSWLSEVRGCHNVGSVPLGTGMSELGGLSPGWSRSLQRFLLLFQDWSCLSLISPHAAPAVPKPALRGSGSGHCTAHCAPQVPPAPPCTGQDYNPQKTLFSFFFSSLSMIVLLFPLNSHPLQTTLCCCFQAQDSLWL